MLNNESWLAHSDLFKKYWVVETKPWVRSLGWFTDYMETVKDAGGWAQAGEKELSVFDYVQIVDQPLAEKKLYRCINGVSWEHISGPVLFVVRKDSEQVFIAGWAGERKIIEKMKKESDDPWQWSEKMIVEVNPASAIRTVPTAKRPKDKTVPVFFVSNGESNADENWKHLTNLYPHAIRIDGINGRRKMFHRCVDLARDAKQFFVITGKNYITDLNVFNYPVETVTDAHIIFHAKNMSNRLEYGHMGIVCYNSHLVLNTPVNFGLDFTQFSKTVTIPMKVSEAYFATSPFEAWRTAFREAVKLSTAHTPDAYLWLQRWTAFAEGPNAEWVLKGAEDGIQYAEQYVKNPDELQKTVDWNWLQERFEELHG